MSQNLLESYKSRLAISEGLYKKEHGNRNLSESVKITIAKCLANTSAFLNEALGKSVGTQRADMGTFKKFALDLTTVVLPNLIAPELVIVKPMSSMTGYIQYVKFVSGTTKGGMAQGTTLNDPFRIGEMNEARVNYTGSHIVEEFTADGTATTFTLGWNPVESLGKVLVAGAEVADKDVTVDEATGVVTLASAPAADAKVRIAYTYDNIVIPQHDIPLLNAKVEGIALQAKARRIAVYYSQMASFQAKTEMGVDLGELLAGQAVAELTYEIDTEIVNLLVDNAHVEAELKFNKTLPVGVSKAEHFEGFSELIERASQKIYDRTRKFGANFMICASDIKPLLVLMRGWKASNAKMAGPYLAGTLNGLKVFVSPAITAGTFVLGFNGDDLMTSSAIYAPYMPIVPTQLLQGADGGTSQGWSTLYDLKLLNPDLLVKGSVVTEALPIQIVDVTPTPAP